MPQHKKLRARLAEAARRYAKGTKTLIDWLGDGGVPVPERQANLRSLACVDCPLNRPVRWTDLIEAGVAEAVKKQESVRLGADMRLALDSKLGMCKACGCYLKLKLWVPFKHIAANTDDKTVKELHHKCWYFREL